MKSTENAQFTYDSTSSSFGSQWFETCLCLPVRDALVKGWLSWSPNPSVPALKRWSEHSRWQSYLHVHQDTLRGCRRFTLSGVVGLGEAHFSRDSKGADVDGDAS